MYVYAFVLFYSVPVREILFFSAKQYSVTGIIGGSSGGSNCCLKS
jgi:hypothetical protein